MSSVYRFYNQKAGGHFFTSSLEERDTIIANVPYFTFEGTAFDTLTPTATGAVNVYRFYNTLTDSHFYTASEAERDIVLQTLPALRFEGVGFSAAMAPGEGLEAVYRFYNFSAGGHFFTSDVSERDVVMKNAGFRYEGIAFYEHHAGYVAPPAGPIETAGVTHDGIFVSGTAGSDIIVGKTVIWQGGTYGDHIEGRGGNDAIYGTSATDEIIAAGGSDTISAGGGDDKLIGSRGSDVLTGGAGADEFMFFAGDGQDRITDFERGDVLRFANGQAGSVFIIAADGPPLPGQSGTSFAGYDVIYGSGASQGSIHLDGITFADLGWVQDSFRYGIA